jgi:cytochrome oxidase Cu insertion factor (SCO1/SenC/PrrC family)
MNTQKINLWLALVLISLLAAACTTTATQPAAAHDRSTEMMAETTPMMEDSQTDESMSSDEMTTTESQNMAMADWYDWDITNVNSGEVFNISDFQGKVVLLETMAVWCPKCLQQQKEVVKLQRSLADQSDLVLVALDIDPNEDSAILSSYTQKQGFNWYYGVASAALRDEIANLYGTQFLNPPSTPMLIIDRQGQAHPLPFGIKSASDLQSALEPYLNGD